MRPALLALAALALLAIGCKKQGMVGTWTFPTARTMWLVEFKADGTYHAQAGGGKITSSGKYTFENDSLAMEIPLAPGEISLSRKWMHYQVRRINDREVELTTNQGQSFMIQRSES